MLELINEVGAAKVAAFARGPHAPPAAPPATVREMPRREARDMDHAPDPWGEPPEDATRCVPPIPPHGLTPAAAMRAFCDPGLLAKLAEIERAPLDDEQIERWARDACVRSHQARRDGGDWFHARPEPGSEEHERRLFADFKSKIAHRTRREMIWPVERSLMTDFYARLRDGRLAGSAKLKGDPFSKRTDIPADAWDDEHIENWQTGTAVINGGHLIQVLVRRGVEPAEPEAAPTAGAMPGTNRYDAVAFLRSFAEKSPATVTHTHEELRRKCKGRWKDEEYRRARPIAFEGFPAWRKKGRRRDK